MSLLKKLEENLIIIENGNYSKVKLALNQWISLYIKKLDSNLQFNISKGVNGIVIIKVNSLITNEKLQYLINYLAYPENVNYEIKIKGFSKITDINIYPKELIGKYVQFYIPENDKEYDFVLGITKSNKNFKIDFGGKFEYLNSSIKFHEPSLDLNFTNSELIYPKKRKVTIKKGKLDKFNFRFSLIATFYVGVSTILGYLSYNTEEFITIMKISSFGLFLWIIFEFEILHHKSAFLKFFILSIILTIIGYYSMNDYSNNSWLKSSKLGLCFLIFYKILRYFYFNKYAREPEFDKRAEKRIDRWFTFILLIGTVISSMIL